MVPSAYENGKRVSENWNSVFDALSAEPRRQLVDTLIHAPPGESVPLPESAAMPNVPSNPETLRVELHHAHLPMLAERGYVEWDTEPFVATRGPRFEHVAVVVEALYGEASTIPDSLVVGCQRLEREREEPTGR